MMEIQENKNEEKYKILTKVNRLLNSKRKNELNKKKKTTKKYCFFDFIFFREVNLWRIKI